MDFDTGKIYRLRGKIQHYDWGGKKYIPELLSIENLEAKPFAEYWMGAHDSCPADLAIEGNTISIGKIISDAPKKTIGDRVNTRFGRLPYLFKILDVKDMLSIQVHPDKKTAEKKFAEENKAGIPLNAYNRNYRDDNHKPELMVALGEFWLLHGFKTSQQLLSSLQSKSEFKPLLSIFEKGGYEALYTHVMRMDQQKVNEMLRPLLERITPAYEQGNLERTNPDFWAARAALKHSVNADIDRGIISIYLLNILKLERGQGLYQPAGLLHAYLEGQNAEMMANSDNVLRGGLTTKYIDVEELITQVNYEPTLPAILDPEPSNGEYRYDVPVDDFLLTRIEAEVGKPININTETTEIFLVLDGQVKFHSTNDLDCRKGDCAVVFANNTIRISADKKSTIFRATAVVKNR